MSWSFVYPDCLDWCGCVHATVGSIISWEVYIGVYENSYIIIAQWVCQTVISILHGPCCAYSTLSKCLFKKKCYVELKALLPTCSCLESLHFLYSMIDCHQKNVRWNQWFPPHRLFWSWYLPQEKMKQEQKMSMRPDDALCASHW